MSEPPLPPLTRIRDFLRDHHYRAAATREGLAAVLGISRSTLGTIEREGKPFTPAQREIVSNTLDIDPIWLLNAAGPIRARDGGEWRPDLVPALVSSRSMISVVNLASSVGLEVLKAHLQAESRSGRPGPATFGVLKLASELDPLRLALAATKA